MASRKNWAYPMQPRFDSNQWVKVFTIFWLTYIAFNVKSPLTTFFNPRMGSTWRPQDTVIIITGALLYCAISLGGLLWAAAFDGLKQLFAKPRWRDLWFVVAYGGLQLLFNAAGTYLASFVPTTFGENLTGTLAAAQFDSLSGFWTATVANFFSTFSSQVIAILIFLYLIQSLLPRFKTAWLGWTVVYGLTCILAGALATTADNSQLLQNILVYGFGQLPLLWAYRRSRNVLVPVLALVIFDRLLIFLLFAIGL